MPLSPAANISAQGLVIVFVEIPFLLRICPVTDRFTSFVRVFNQNLPRAGFYLG
jgi:hypothetical protein